MYSTYQRPAGYQPRQQQQGEEDRRPAHRRTVDHGSAFGKWHLDRLSGRTIQPANMRAEQSYIVDLLPPSAYTNINGSLRSTNPHITSVAATPAKFIQVALNKVRHPVYSATWTPDGRRLLTGSMSGEFTLWNGMTFNFESIMQAHESGVRSLKYSHSGEWLLSGDHEGNVKFWQPSLNCVNVIDKAHRESIRELAFAPSDHKFVTGSDDGLLKIWDFHESSTAESVLKGHGWDVKSVDWHSELGLIVSGSKDNLIKLWDPRSAKNVNTFHGFKNTVMKTTFQPTGTKRLLAAGCRDRTCRILDLRMLHSGPSETGPAAGGAGGADMPTRGDRSMAVLRGHDSDVFSLTWHPTHANVVTSGTKTGSIYTFNVDTTPAGGAYGPDSGILPVNTIPSAHDYCVSTLDYHPEGHVLCSGGLDRMTRFWARPRPGDPTSFRDKYYEPKEEGVSVKTLPGVNNATSRAGMARVEHVSTQHYNTAQPEVTEDEPVSIPGFTR